jgi:type IV pilus assembly protein PilY1
MGINASDIGQTWSAPRIVTTKGYSSAGKPKPMVIMGGGYDTCEDADPNTCTNLSKGRKVYVLDAETGERRWDFTTERGVVADVFVVPDKSTGLILYAYVVDLGGNIYRISGGTTEKPAPINSPESSLDAPQWVFTKIAKLGCDDGSSSCEANRKFMYMPDVVEDSGGYVLLVGSGDREKPLKDYTSAYGVANYFFMLRDFPTKEGWLQKDEDECGGNYMCLKSLLEISGKDNPDPDDLSKKKGWYLAMNEGEQVVTSAITVYGATTFSTHTPEDPPEGACTSDLGTARVYNIKYSNAAPSKKGMDRSQEVDGGGLPPSPVAGRVTLDTGEEVSFIIGASKDSSIDGSEPIPPELTTLPKSITYWYIER